MRPDLDALKDNNLFWVGEHWDRHTKAKLDAVLTEYFTDGMTRVALAQRMADDFRSLTSRSHVYWQAVADHMATKGREIGRVTGYQRAGIQRVQIRAHLDERTTPVCRQLHGRVIEVDTLADQRDAYFEASARGDKLAMADIWTMHGKGADLSNTRTRDLKGIGSPPYHYNCRTITVAYWDAGTETPLDDVPSDQPPVTLEHISEKVYQREPLTRKEIGGIVDRARSAHWASARDSYKRHFVKHGAGMGLPFQDEYNQSAIDLIRRGNRDVFLSMRNGSVDVVFARPEANAAGDDGFLSRWWGWKVT